MAFSSQHRRDRHKSRSSGRLFSHFSFPFGPIAASWAVIGRSNPTLADVAARSAGSRRQPARSVDCGS